MLHEEREAGEYGEAQQARGDEFGHGAGRHSHLAASGLIVQSAGSLRIRSKRTPSVSKLPRGASVGANVSIRVLPPASSHTHPDPAAPLLVDSATVMPQPSRLSQACSRLARPSSSFARMVAVSAGAKTGRHRAAAHPTSSRSRRGSTSAPAARSRSPPHRAPLASGPRPQAESCRGLRSPSGPGLRPGRCRCSREPRAACAG
jgi:hypothetical protein